MFTTVLFQAVSKLFSIVPERKAKGGLVDNVVQVAEEPSIQIEAEKIELIEEATPETADEIPEEIVAPPEEFGDTVNTLRSGQESPKHSFSSLELREYTEKVIRFTLNELRRDDFICTFISKRFNEQVKIQAK